MSLQNGDRPVLHLGSPPGQHRLYSIISINRYRLVLRQMYVPVRCALCLPNWMNKRICYRDTKYYLLVQLYPINGNMRLSLKPVHNIISYLKNYGYRNKHNQQGVELVLGAHLKHVLQLRSVRRQECDVQHPLCHSLFRRIAICIQPLELNQNNEIQI